MDVKSPDFQKAILDLRSKVMSESPQPYNQVANALDPQYWRGLNSKMTVCASEPSEPLEIADAEASAVASALQTLSAFGYFKTPPIAREASVQTMRNCLETTQSAGWHPVFVFVYDQFWSAFRGPAMVRFLTGALGSNYGQLPFLWGHSVAPNSRGWRPHVDGPSGLEKLTVWLALNDATLENGCMYVVPRNAETEKISNQFATVEFIDRNDVRNLFQNVRALPAPAGSYLGWKRDVIHWGSKSGPWASPRLSVSVEFARRSSDPQEDNGELLDTSPGAPLPSLETRLRIIANAIRNYEAFDPSVIRHLALAEQILLRINLRSSPTQ